MIPLILKIDYQLAPLLVKYTFIFEYNGLKFRLGEEYEEKIKNQEPVDVKLISLPQSCDIQFDESDFLDLLTAIRNYDRDC